MSKTVPQLIDDAQLALDHLYARAKTLARDKQLARTSGTVTSAALDFLETAGSHVTDLLEQCGKPGAVRKDDVQMAAQAIDWNLRRFAQEIGHTLVGINEFRKGAEQ